MAPEEASSEERANDSNTTIAELRALVETFAAERNWEQFHTPKNLAMSAAIEAAEIMEHFQWLTPRQSLDVVNDPDKMREIGEEIADVISYLLSLSAVLKIDLSDAIHKKVIKNSLKYPAEEYRDRFGPDDPAFND